MDVDLEKQAAAVSTTPTTFGAIIEKRAPAPSTTPPTVVYQTSNLPLPSGLSQPQTPSGSTASLKPIHPPHLHLQPSAGSLSGQSALTIDPPLPSPFSATDSLAQHETARDFPYASNSDGQDASSHPRSSDVKCSADSRVKECSMWPSQDQLKARAKQDKRARLWGPMARLSKRNRFIVSVVIALTVIGAAVGIGVGVSRATNGEVWAGTGKSKPIPS